MNSATFSGFARTGLVVIVVVLAIVAGLAVGNAINGRAGDLNGGAAVPVSRVANTSFSLDALRQLQAIRGDSTAPAYVDYGVRHGAETTAEEYEDFGVRHIEPKPERAPMPPGI